MTTRQHLVWLPLALLGAGLWMSPARSGPDEDVAATALAAAVTRGGEVFNAPWTKGGKTCAACHAKGPNRLTAARLKSYPKYDKAWEKVLTGQQKMNQMISLKAGGEMLALGSADMNALEAYVASLN